MDTRSPLTIVLIVRDIETASRWYRYVLNFRMESERVGINGLPLEAHLWRPTGPDLVLQRAETATSEARRETPLTFIVADDLNRVAERAASIEDASPGKPAERTTTQPQLVLHDPDGHELVLMNGPAPPS